MQLERERQLFCLYYLFTRSAVCVKCNFSKSGLKSAACQNKGVGNKKIHRQNQNVTQTVK
jgi:hypothetical protein